MNLQKDCLGLIIKSLVSLSKITSSFLFRKFLLKIWGLYIYIYVSKIYDGVLQWHFFKVALKVAGFSISFSSIFKIIFHNIGGRIVILYLLFISLKKIQRNYFEESLLGNDAKALKNSEKKILGSFLFLTRCRKRSLLKIFTK